MYQLALKVKDRYIINSPGIIYLDKKELIPQVKENKVLIQYNPFAVFQQIDGELKEITTKKEKV